jgi:hypothetical protein
MPLRVCRCGCGQPSETGFVRGHWRTYAAALRQRARIGDANAFQEMYDAGYMLESKPGKTAFGVEAEFFGIDQSSAADVITSIGHEAVVDGYHHDPVPHWRVTEDGSVTGEACELVSPILKRRQADFTMTREIVTALRQNGGVVDRSCGLHVHHNATGMTPMLVAEAVSHWSLFQPLINMLLPAGRVSYAEYCRPMENPGRWHRSVMDQADGTLDSLTARCHSFGRYHAINLSALQAHGTLEFRQHQGTLNGTKIENWVKFTRLFMDIGEARSCLDTINEYGSEDAVTSALGLDGMFDYIGAPKALLDYYKGRSIQLGHLPQPVLSVVPDPEDTQCQSGPVCGPDEENWCAACGEYHEPEEWDGHDDTYDPADDF